MKIRIMGTKDECELARKYYRELEKDANVKKVVVSDPYANRGSSTEFRVYVDIEYRESALSQKIIGGAVALTVSEVKELSQRLKDEYFPIITGYFSDDEKEEAQELNRLLCEITDEIFKEIMTGGI